MIVQFKAKQIVDSLELINNNVRGKAVVGNQQIKSKGFQKNLKVIKFKAILGAFIKVEIITVKN